MSELMKNAVASACLVIGFALVVVDVAIAESPAKSTSQLLEEIAAMADSESTSGMAARVHRQLVQLPTTERYELLVAWTLPENSQSLRSVKVPCRVDAPPKEFARAIGERPRSDSFLLPRNHVFDTQAMLLDVAHESGRLQSLIRMLDERGGDDASQLVALAKAFRERSDATKTADTGEDESESLWVNFSDKWTAREDHIQHRGDDLEYIQCRYPLTGHFRVDIDEVATPADSKASWVYRGRVFSSLFGYANSSVDERSLVIDDQSTTALVNGHPVVKINGPTTSPWLGLRSSTGNTMFRNLRITGDVQVLKEVPLLIEDQSDGWKTRGGASDSDDWVFRDSELKSPEHPYDEHEQQIRYTRPLRENENITYELFYEQGKQIAHPTFGRIAFLLRPEGIDLHWVTDGKNEWTGLQPDNAITEPLNRRGPKQLPLRSGDWNQVALSRQNGELTITLNGTVVYTRTTEDISDHRFGIFHNPQAEQVRVRGAVLAGDWPAMVPLDAFVQPVPESNEGNWPEEILASNVRELLRRTDSLSLPEKYKQLAEWVLPNDTRPTFRIPGTFASQSERASQEHLRAQPILSPALMLVDAAKELGNLEELDATVVEIVANDEASKRAREAILALIDIAMGRNEQVVSRLEKMYRLTEDNVDLPIGQRWPELLLASRAVTVPTAREILRDWLMLMKPRTAVDDNAIVGSHLQSILSMVRLPDEKEFANTEQIELRHWHAISRFGAESSGKGRADSRWAAVDGCVQALPGYGEDYLIFDQPLLGDYEVHCEIAKRTNTDAQMWVGGLQSLVQVWSNTIRTGSPDRGFIDTKIDPPLELKGDWVRQRIIVRDGVRTLYVNGRKLDEQQVPVDAFPWVAIRNTWENFGSFRDVRIVGQPSIPTELSLLNERLIGWRPYFSYSVRYPSGWSMSENGELVGDKSDYPSGSGCESSLYYQRPIVEDGVIEYQFFYEAGTSLVHPSLDRVAFFIEPDGVRLHSITDGRFDQSGANPVNVHDARQSERGSGPLPLVEGDWNRMRFVMQGDQCQLHLNGKLVFEHPIGNTNERLFGLFHFRDQTTARARDIVYRGNWPRELASLDQQELSDKRVFRLDKEAEELAATFHHDFATDGLPTDLFNHRGASNATRSIGPAGLTLDVPGTASWNQCDALCRLRAVGDFDISAEYTNLDVSVTAAGGAFLGVGFSTKDNASVRAVRTNPVGGKKTLNAHLQLTAEDGAQQRHYHKPIDCESTAGTMRLARRGSQVIVLARESDSSEFYIVGEYEQSAGPTKELGIGFSATTTQGGRTKVTWRNLDIRAERLLSDGAAGGEQRIYTMNADGNDLKQLTKDFKDLGNHGSPTFSPDGLLIAFDTFRGSTATSHILLMNDDGSNLRDLGLGSMATFTPDGKRLAFSSREGMMIMDIDGSNREVLSSKGWSIQLSPDGRQATFYESGRVGDEWAANLVLFNLATKQQTNILEGDQATRFRQIFWSSDWSPNNREVCFGAISRTTGEQELVVANVAGSNHGFTVLHTGTDIGYDIAWHPDGEHLLVSRTDPEFGNKSLFVMDRNQPERQERLAGQPLEQDVRGPEWSHDGKRIVFSSIPLSEYGSSE